MELALKRKEIYRLLNIAAQRAYTRGIQTGSGGNISARDALDGHMIVKASGGSFADCTAEGDGFVITDYAGNRVNADDPKPTREFLLHGMLYGLSDKINGVVHCHSPWSVAYAYENDVLPMTTHHVKLKLGHDIPVLDVDSAMLREAHIPLVQALFAKTPTLTAFILRGHGVVTIGKDVLEAEHNAELIEETAQIATLRALLAK